MSDEDNPDKIDGALPTATTSVDDILGDEMEIIESEYAYVDKNKIIRENLIPDFAENSFLNEAEVYKAEDNNYYYCTEGCEYLDSGDEPQIKCHIRHVKKYNPYALAEIKAGGRSKTSGRARYAENVRNLKILLQQAKDLGAEIKFPTQGGSRRGPSFIPQGSEKFIRRLMKKFKVERPQILQYKDDGEKLNMDTLDYLVSVNATQGFFKLIRNPINRVVKDLIAFMDVPDEKITDEDHAEANEYIEELLYEDVVNAYKQYDPKAKTVGEFSPTTGFAKEDVLLSSNRLYKSIDFSDAKKETPEPEMKMPPPQKDELDVLKREHIKNDLLELSDKIKLAADSVAQQDVLKKTVEEAYNILMDIMEAINVKNIVDEEEVVIKEEDVEVPEEQTRNDFKNDVIDNNTITPGSENNINWFEKLKDDIVRKSKNDS